MSARVSGPSRPAIEAAAAAYLAVKPSTEGSQPGRRSRWRAARILEAAHDPAIGPDRSVRLSDLFDAIREFGEMDDIVVIEALLDNLKEEFIDP